MDRVPGVFGLVILIAGAWWVYISPPGFASPLAWAIASLIVIVVFMACQESIRGLIVLLLTVVLGPALLAFLIGLLNYLRLDTASSVTEETWNSRERPSTLRPLLVHVSDTHFIGREAGETRQGDPWNVQLLRKVKDRIISLQPHYLVLSGDITDLGQDSGWERAKREFLSPISQAGITIVMAPGNHDIQPFFSDHPQIAQFRRPQLNRFLREASTYGLNLQTAGGSLLADLLTWKPPLDAAEILKRYNDTLSSCEANCGPGGDGPAALMRICTAGCRSSAAEVTKGKGPLSYEEYTEDACSTWYPMMHFDPETHVTFIVLCSVANVVTRVGTNAVGEVGDRQLKAFHEALAAVPSDARQIFVVVHHPVVKRQGDRYGFPTRLTKSALLSSSAFEFATLPHLLREAREIVTALRDAASLRPNATVYLVFGHRHGRFLGKLAQAKGGGPWVWVSEAPAAFDPLGGIRIGYTKGSTAIDWIWWGNSE